MANPHANADGTVNMKTPGYAWPCLVVSLLCAISIVFAWMWLPGVTFPTFNQWALTALSPPTSWASCRSAR